MKLTKRLREVPEHILYEVGHISERNATDIMCWNISLESAEYIEALEDIVKKVADGGFHAGLIAQANSVLNTNGKNGD